eukprot:5301793-Amphidinium_carterae.1
MILKLTSLPTASRIVAPFASCTWTGHSSRIGLHRHYLQQHLSSLTTRSSNGWSQSDSYPRGCSSSRPQQIPAGDAQDLRRDKNIELPPATPRPFQGSIADMSNAKCYPMLSWPASSGDTPRYPSARDS